jgi:NAD(P)-dependent dehydrogenase (short-subunit alcohol dehydrogenase family)
MSTAALAGAAFDAPVLVTGAASGIGAALVAVLRDHGQDVIALDRVPGPDIVECDLSRPASVAAAVAGLPERLGGLANVAGVPGTAPSATVLAVNWLAPKLLATALSPRLVPGAAVVNVASVAAHRNTQPAESLRQLADVTSLDDVTGWLDAHPVEGPAAYDTSKRVLVDWTVLHAASLLSAGTRALSISPGPVETPILRDFATSMGQDAMDRSEAAVGRHGRAEEVAAVIAFALSPAATWLNGIDILVEGGLMAARAASSQ